MPDGNVIVERALAEFRAAADPASLENAKARYLGKSGELTALLPALGALAPAGRKAAGTRINAAKERIEQALETRRGELSGARLQARLAEGALDVTLPGRGRGRGGIHPIIRTWQRVEAIFGSIGFGVAHGPRVAARWDTLP